MEIIGSIACGGNRRNNNEKGVSVFTITNKVYMKCDKRGWSCQLKQIAKYPCNDIGKQ